jgi:hypothetical protein
MATLQSRLDEFLKVRTSSGRIVYVADPRKPIVNLPISPFAARLAVWMADSACPSVRAGR